jgi:hypothetical protein
MTHAEQELKRLERLERSTRNTWQISLSRAQQKAGGVGWKKSWQQVELSPETRPHTSRIIAAAC